VVKKKKLIKTFTVKCSIPPPQGRLGGDSVWMRRLWI